MGTKEDRISNIMTEIRRLYLGLYGREDKLDELIQSIGEAAARRKEPLLELDSKRLADPFWYLSPLMTGMTMYTDLFCGTFRGLKDRIGYLCGLGVTYLHLMPFLRKPAGENDGGFAVSDFLSTDPSLGTNQDLEELADALREAGISLCMDFVMNHTSDEHEWAMRAKRGEKEYQARYYTFPDRTEPDEYEKTTPEVFPSTAPGNFIYSPEMGRWVMSSFYPYQWDIDYHNPDVFNDIVRAAMMWANLGVEVFRLDAVPYIWKEKGTSSRNLPQVHTIVRLLRLVLEAVAPAVILKGEVVMAPAELAAYFGSADEPECHLLYSVSDMVNIWGALSSKDTRLLYSQVEDFLRIPGGAFVNYIRCHDDIGWGFDEEKERQLGIDPLLHKIFQYRFYEGSFPGSFASGELYNYDPATRDARSCGTTLSLCGLEKAIAERSDEKIELALKRFRLLYSVVYSLPGIPLINSGDEIGQLNDLSYRNDPLKKDDSRYIHRSPFRWEAADSLANPESIPSRLHSILLDLRRLRESLPMFSHDAEVFTWHTENDAVFALRRRSDKGTLLSVFNFSPEPQAASFPYFTGMYRDFFSGERFEPGAELRVQGYDVLFLVSE